uniref:DUF4614 domain-containing protein n=1 Tax=Timema genevievae TaxID=629358 RepID=A0A7R9K9M2_TIMGE|nr:unnamed protein product [Timema genevievae]
MFRLMPSILVMMFTVALNYEVLAPLSPVDVAVNQMLRQQIQLTRHLIASHYEVVCVVGLAPLSPVDVAVNQMLKQQIQLTRHLIESQYSMYKAYTTSVKFMRERYKPVTLNETKKMFTFQITLIANICSELS